MPSDVVFPRFASLYSSKTVRFALLILAVCAVCVPADAGPVASTTTALNVSSGSVVAGTPVTLTATVVEDARGSLSPVTQGTVIFCDATAAHCADSAILGTAQLTTGGTAAIKLTLGVGTYSISAAFQGRSAPPSVSAPQLLTVDGNASYLSFSQIASSGTPGNYTLIGAVTAFGKNVPTGTVSFLDTDSGDAVVGTAVLDPTTLGFTLLPAFGSPATVGSRPQNTVLGDFNNDGRLDLAATNVSANTISVLLGNGDGTFQLQTAYATGASPIAIASGDFNRDGNLDLVAGNAGAATISVYLGNGDGTFLPQQVYAVGNGPQSIAVADFNGDGFLDLAVLDRNDRNVTILLGQGDGTFQVELNVCEDPLTFPIGESGQVVATADFNGDGAADLAVTDAQTSRVDVLLGMGDGTFQGQVTYVVGFNPIGLAIADFNEDGVPDLAVANAESNTVSVLLGVGDGTFQPHVIHGTGSAPEGVSVGDFNGDGNMDLVVSNNGNSRVS
ncbi:MAG: FG-GAP-like repeat-containing protein, partial [Terriglobales bacterium]